MTKTSLYPLKFAPIHESKIWGGEKLKDIYNIENQNNIGESWVLSGYEGKESVVTNGFLAGNTLTELVEVYMGDLIGDKIYEKFNLSFPLLFKLIDANDNLSIQVHPNDEYAAEHHNSFGKTEMWYVVDCEIDSELIIGFKNDCSKEEYLTAVENDTIENLLQNVPIKRGDVFFIPAGRVHAIGKGALIAEIQQSSDITYRIYDYKRKDDNGNERELHLAQAVDVIDFSFCKTPKTTYTEQINKITPLVKSDYFVTNLLSFDQKIIRNFAALDSFVVYMCVEGGFSVEFNGEKITVEKGETLFIPAEIDELELVPTTEKASLLEVSIQE